LRPIAAANTLAEFSLLHFICMSQQEVDVHCQVASFNTRALCVPSLPYALLAAGIAMFIVLHHLRETVCTPAAPAAAAARPAKYFSIDRVFRNEAVDRTHLAEFHQVEGLVCDRGLTLGHLIATLQVRGRVQHLHTHVAVRVAQTQSRSTAPRLLTV
jgi:hypothetical protein